MNTPDLSVWLNYKPLPKDIQAMEDIYNNPLYQRAVNLYTQLDFTARFIDNKVKEWHEGIKEKYIPLNEHLRMTVEEYREYLADWKNTPKDYTDRWKE